VLKEPTSELERQQRSWEIETALRALGWASRVSEWQRETNEDLSDRAKER
jgi:hypothetical protein